MMKHTRATPAQTGTNSKPATQILFGAVAVNSRGTRSRSLAEVGTDRVVLTRFDRLAPSIPAARTSRAIQSRPIMNAVRQAAFPQPAAPVDLVVVRPEPDELWSQFVFRHRTRGQGAGLASVVAARGRLQQNADELAPEPPTLDDVVLVRVDERERFR